MPVFDKKLVLPGRRGKPEVFIDLEEVSKLTFLPGTTDLEIAIQLGVSLKSIQRAKKMVPYKEADAKGRAKFMLQLRTAIAASATVDRNMFWLRLLAKQYLGMDVALDPPANALPNITVINETKAAEKAPTLNDFYDTVKRIRLDAQAEVAKTPVTVDATPEAQPSELRGGSAGSGEPEPTTH